MIYECQLLYERGAAMPKWQTAFGVRYVGTLMLSHERDTDGLWSCVATLKPMPFLEVQSSWPRPLWRVTTGTEWEDCRYVEGVEILVTPGATRYLRQVWRLAQLDSLALAKIEELTAASRPPSADSETEQGR